MGQIREINLPDLYPKQYNAVFTDARYSYIEGATKSGKSSHVDATVYTPSGPERMGDIEVNSKVCTPGGGVATVIGTYPQGEMDIYEVTFHDGSSTRVTGDHWWVVQGYSHETSGRMYTTEQLMEMSIEKRWVPHQGEVYFHEREVPVDPYVLGVLLAEGGMTIESRVMVSSGDGFIVRELKERLPEGVTLNKKSGDNVDYRLVDTTKPGNQILESLRRLGLSRRGSHEKFIPEKYKYNSVEVRKDVIRGVLDGDGWLNERGHPRLGQTSQRLADDVTEVIESLGGETRTREEDPHKSGHKKVYRQSIKYPTPSDLFNLPRKKDACETMERKVRKKFRSIEYVGKGEAKCIKIDDPRALYLTDNFISTHNTLCCLVWLFYQAANTADGNDVWWVAPYSWQSNMAFRRMQKMLPDAIYEENKTEKYIKIEGAGRIWFKTAENEQSLYGEDVYAVVCDEASRMSWDAYEAIRSTIFATGAPLRAIGNVVGRNNWLYDKCRKAERGELDNAEYHKLTAEDAVAADETPITQQDLDEAEKDYEHDKQKFRALFYCEPPEHAGNPIGLEAITRCTVDARSTNPPVVFGWDLARAQNYTVGIGLDEDGHVTQMHRWQGKPWPEMKRDILTHIGATPTIVDQTGVGDPMFEFLQESAQGPMIPFQFSARSKQHLFERLKFAIQKEKVHYPKGTALVKELRNLEYDKSGRTVTYQTAASYNDDCVDALALAWYLYEQRHLKSEQRNTEVHVGGGRSTANPFRDDTSHNPYGLF